MLKALIKTQPILGGVDQFKIGASRFGTRHWKGWLDEFRIGFFIESEDSISASYQSQRPDALQSYTTAGVVEGPPIILKGQLGEGFANDSSQSFSYLVQTFPSADSFSVVGLPAGLTFDESTGEISGIPLQGGNYQVTVTAENSFGSDQGSIQLRFAAVSAFSHRADFSFSNYDGGETLSNFPVFITFDSSIPKFSLKSFASAELNDLRFFDDAGRELNYEIELIEPDENRFSAWVQVPEMNASNSISAHWGDPNLANTTPSYTVNGSTWSNDFNGVWHYRPMSLTSTLTDSTYFRNHADDKSGFTDESGILGTGRSFPGGAEQFIEIPSSFSLDDLDQESFTFSTWIRLENLPDDKASDSFLGQGYLTNHLDSYFTNIESLKAISPSGFRIFQEGPRNGLFFNNDADFKDLNIGISRNDNYVTLFLAYFKAPADGVYKFRCENPDDKFALWLDLDGDGVLSTSGGAGDEEILTRLSYSPSSFDSDGVTLVENQEYQIAIAHGEGNGGSRLKPWILTLVRTGESSMRMTLVNKVTTRLSSMALFLTKSVPSCSTSMEIKKGLILGMEHWGLLTG